MNIGAAFLCSLIVLVVILVFFQVKWGTIIKIIFANVFLGLGSLLIISSGADLLGFLLPINEVTVAISTLLGLPGTIVSVLMKLFLIV